mgnify:FL=1|jgi:hypothetical protein
MSKLFVDEIVHQSSQGSGTITLGASGEKINLGTGVSGGTFTSKPMFQAWLSASFSTPNATRTLVPFDVSELNDDSCFNTSTNRFTAPSAGRYLFHCTLFLDDLDDGDLCQIWLYKNGNRDFTFGGSTKRYLAQDFSPTGGRNLMPTVTAIIDLAKDDYVQSYVYHDQGSSQSTNATYSYFQGFRLIGA